MDFRNFIGLLDSMTNDYIPGENIYFKNITKDF